ncbi:MAG: hypothetical protein LPK46_08495 [Bacteroidota bacterium]|nr:hypothetical protein [Bacteroidota bacterium]
MRRILFPLIMAFLAIPESAKAQLEIGFTGGYQFSSRGTVNYGYVNVGDGPSTKFDLNFRLEDNYFGFSYSGVETDAYLSGFYNYDTERNYIRMNYYELHYERSIPTGSDIFQPFGGMQAGWLHVNNQTTGGSADRLYLGATLGLRAFLTEKFGLRGYFNLNAPIEGFGASFYAGTGGSGAGVSTYSTMVFFSVGGGVFLQLGG